ncbi:MAG TPA: phage major capsid protein [Methanocorpusculum sp.]|nr:phage major capsid protein [Methanocorpusculum sp.]
MNLKKLLETRAIKQEEMKKLLEGANAEERAMNTEEREQFDKLEEEIRGLDATIVAIQTARELEDDEPDATGEPENRSVEEREYDTFDAFLRNQIENRDAANMTAGENGAVIPSSIANKIIEKVVDLCPIYHDADRYNVGGTLTIPYYDETTGDIEMQYAEEFTDGESKSGKFKSISLTGYLGRAICDVSKSLINNSQFDLVNFVIKRMSRSIAKFLEKELLIGTDTKIAGLSGITQKVVAASAKAVTADEIIDLQEAVPDAYQAGAYFIMNKSTRTAIRKLKDGQGNYLLNKDANSRWGYTLFGKDVYTSANMPGMDAGAKASIYVDPR